MWISSRVWFSSYCLFMNRFCAFGPWFFVILGFGTDFTSNCWWYCECQDLVFGQLRLNRRWASWISWYGCHQELDFVSTNFFKIVFVLLELVFTFSYNMGPIPHLLVRVPWVSRPWIWPAETKQTCNKLNASLWCHENQSISVMMIMNVIWVPFILSLKSCTGHYMMSFN